MIGVENVKIVSEEESSLTVTLLEVLYEDPMILDTSGVPLVV
jgi:hypothetical protein